MSDTYVGFDSAWTDNAKAPGAICALSFQDAVPRFAPPRLVSFSAAQEFTRSVQSAAGCTLVALDQPTIVSNATGMRPVERVAASLVSWLGGGVQPSNRGRVGMFNDDAPIWAFLKALDATEDPVAARQARDGLHLIEVFPALALPSLDPRFFGRLAAPRYNPGRRKTFKLEDWVKVSEATANQFRQLGLEEPAEWCFEKASIAKPTKADQDMLDSAICLLIALRWRRLPPTESMMIGDSVSGYMVLPASLSVRAKLVEAAKKMNLPVWSEE